MYFLITVFTTLLEEELMSPYELRHLTWVKRKAGSDYLDATKVDQLIEPRDIVMRQAFGKSPSFTPCGNHLILIFRFAVGTESWGILGMEKKLQTVVCLLENLEFLHLSRDTFSEQLFRVQRTTNFDISSLVACPPTRLLQPKYNPFSHDPFLQWRPVALMNFFRAIAFGWLCPV